MKKIKKHLIASVISFLIGIIALYIMQYEQYGKVNSSFAVLIVITIYWRVIIYFNFKEKGIRSGKAFFLTFRFLWVSDGIERLENGKKKKAADDFAKQLFLTKKK